MRTRGGKNEERRGAATTVDKTFTARQWRLRGALLCRVFKRGETSGDACHWVTCDDNGERPRRFLPPPVLTRQFENLTL